MKPRRETGRRIWVSAPVESSPGHVTRGHRGYLQVNTRRYRQFFSSLRRFALVFCHRLKCKNVQQRERKNKTNLQVVLAFFQRLRLLRGELVSSLPDAIEELGEDFGGVRAIAGQQFVHGGSATVESPRGSMQVKVGRRGHVTPCLLYTSPSPRDATLSRMPSSA